MLLPLPTTTQADAVTFVRDHLADYVCDDVEPSLRFCGSQAEADKALASFDVTGYADRRNEVYPQPKRGASGLSPFIRHGLLTLDEVWRHVEDGPSRDTAKFRDELLWQEYARHWYGRFGRRTRHEIEHQVRPTQPSGRTGADGWNRDMACIELTVDELEEDGWLVNQTRMWLASEWAVRRGQSWQEGEDEFFRHLLDGSRAANRLGWQWTIGAISAKPYGFTRWQVEKRAPSLCASCDLVHSCPIEEWPENGELPPAETPVALSSDLDPEAVAGPSTATTSGEPDSVWLTAESLGHRDPALAAHPDLPAIFVFDAPLLAKLKLSSKRLVFITEILAELAVDRSLEIHLGRPAEVLRDRRPAVTFAPVPGFRRLATELDLAVVHPYPWLVRPSGRTLSSFSAWRRSVRRGSTGIGRG